MKKNCVSVSLVLTAMLLHAALFAQIRVEQVRFRKDTVDIRKFGAVPDGVTLNTGSIQNAINTLAKKGGGVVLIPQGSWLTGPIRLQSNINLHVSARALVLFTPDFDQYPLVVSSFEGVAAARCMSPITAEKLNNIAITGTGILNGNGVYWRPLKKEKVTDSEWKNHQKKFGGALTEDKKMWYPSAAAVEAAKTKNIGKLSDGKTLEDYQSIKDFLRPNMVRIAECTRVLIEGVTLENSPAWTTHCLMSSEITIKGLKVKNPWFGTNTDALDLESCRNVRMEDCVFDTGDDGITIKSGRDAEGRKRGMPTENVYINNCTVYRAHGGFVIGSEMSGGARNITITNCTFIGTDIGLRFKTVRGRGGIVENIKASNIYMKDIIGEAILFDMYYAAQDPIALAGEKREPPRVEILPVTEATPVFRNFDFDNIYCAGAEKAIFIRGIPEMPVEQVRISNSVLQADKGVDIQEAKNIQLEKVTVLSKDTNPVCYLLNVRDVVANQFDFTDKSGLLILAQGDRSGKVAFTLKAPRKAAKLSETGYGFPQNALTIQNIAQ
jgi:DNA sulfur modification protein DndE